MEEIRWADFERVDIRVGKIVEVKAFPEARNPSYRLSIDFGQELGKKRSSAQITQYAVEELIGRQVLCVVNFPPKQIATAISEVLVLGVPAKDGSVVLLSTEREVPLGGRVF